MTACLRSLSFAAAALLLAATLAHAELGGNETKPACCQLTTSLATDALRGDDLSGDERFFMNEGTPSNLHFLIDTSASMRELPQLLNGDHEAFFASGDGCTQPDLLAVQADKGWNPNTAYPVPDPDQPGLFQDGKFYAYHYWEDLNAPPARWNTKEDACVEQHPATTDPSRTFYNQCLQCLNTKGFYKRPGATGAKPGFDPRRITFVFWGRFLNFNPPKYVAAKATLKSVLKDVSRVRVGLSYFDADNTRHGALMAMPQGPSCDALAQDGNAFSSVRAQYLAAVDGLRFRASTPLAESLLNVGQYFSSSNDIYTNTFGFDASYLKTGFQNTALSDANRSWCWRCQSTSIVIITDGEPSSDDTVPAARIQALNGGTVTCPDEEACPDDAQYKLDDVARLLATKDLQRHVPDVVGNFDTSGQQSLTIYAVGFGIHANVLKNAARVGGGRYYQTNDGPELKRALMDILAHVNRRATAFSTASVAGFQLSGAGGTLVPRLRPGQDKNEAWRGFLYRYQLGSELLLGCDAAQAASSSGHPKDLNRDGDCNDLHLIDMDGDAIVENELGDFVKQKDPLRPARPFWEAGQQLKPVATPTQKWRTRNIYTIVDSAGPSGATPDGRIDRYDAPIAFTEDNAALLREYLGIGPAGPCPVPGYTTLIPDECAKVVIRYYRGADVLNPDPNRRNDDRAFLLHDIFHSAPQSVEPPMPRAFCGFSNQCLQTLFSGRTKLKQDYTTPNSTQKRDAYDEYVARHGERDRVVLVGSNGGMLHAFHNGSSTGLDPVTKLVKHDNGTGEELWAFVPPDMLPKLTPRVGKHGWFVDGTPMVREVWLDGVGSSDTAVDGEKQAGEYRTVAVMGSGSGGVHRFALDLTELLHSPGVGQPSRAPDRKGDFLWMWPQPCDSLALQLGESDGHFAPRPPPMGPVALADPSGPWQVDGQPAREQWVAFLNGGFDRSLSRGRGLAMVDLGTGETLWSFFQGDGSPRSEHLRHPFAASVAMLDIGQGDSTKQDGDLLFDTATVADYGGQVWTVRFWEPGQRSGPGQPVTNWYAARSFQVEAASADTVRPPFSYMTSNTLQADTGYLRTFVGTGDRYNLADNAGTTCRLSNPLGCAQLGCQASQTVTIERGGSPAWSSTTSFSGYKYTSATSTVSPGGAACSSARVSLAWNYAAENGCTATSSGRVDYVCGQGASGWECSVTQDDWASVQATKPLPAASPHRYYGFWSYGVNAQRRFRTQAEASSFDANLLTEDDLVDVSQFDASGGVTSGEKEATALQKGWYLQYGNAREQTGSGSALLNGCVVWNSFEANSSSNVCGTAGNHTARVYQASFVGGNARCADGFHITDASGGHWQRYTARNVVAVPADPAPQRSLERVDIVFNEAGGPQRLSISDDNEVLQSLYQLEVDRSTHTCRHEGQQCE
jgi:type IV pilus assembly protein PilY1